MFCNNYSGGFTSAPHLPDDAVYAVDSVRYPFLLPAVDSGVYRVVGICYL